MVALSLAPQVSAQARERTVHYCTNCISQRAISDVDLHGALAKKDVDVGTDVIVIDGPQNTSLVYQATVVASLDHPSQSHRPLADGRQRVMKSVADRFDDLVALALRFHNAEPVDWQKEFVPEGP